MITVIHPGLLSSLQDAGRFGYRSFGVPWSGPMDSFSAGLAKELVQNTPEDAVLEFYQRGPSLQFDADAVIAVTGQNFELVIDGESKSLFRAHKVKSGQLLSINSLAATNFGYLAIAGGFDSERVLGSRSYCQGITTQIRLERGDKLKFNEYHTIEVPSLARLKSIAHIFHTEHIEVTAGPEYDKLSPEQKEILWNSSHKLSRNINRMGYRFNPTPGLHSNGILTGPVQAGTVQLTPGGELIVLMRDAQTTGGYARILQLMPDAISVLAQQVPGTTLQFRLKTTT